MVRSKIKTVVLAICAATIAFSLIAFPNESVKASIRGLAMWWEIVFPSLLPFLIISEIMIGFGVVKFIGVLLEPFMRPLFKVPGVGGFAWAIGMASGYPAGAKLSARLRQEGQLTKIEAERLVSFTNCSNPLFIFGAVSVGFFQNPNLGIVLAAAHYLGNITIGILMRFHGQGEKESNHNQTRFSIKRAFAELHETRIKDNRPIGKLLGDAVRSSIETLLMIGGFIILFSVINQLLFVLKITPFLGELAGLFFKFIMLPVSLTVPFISGLFEITLGSQLVSEVKDSTLLQQAMIVSMIIGFNGFSVQAQVASILAQTDISFKPYLFARVFHGLFACFYTSILWKYLYAPANKQIYEGDFAPASAFFENNFNANLYFLAKDIGPAITIISLLVYILLFAWKSAKNEH